MPIRILSPLPDATERVVQTVIGAAIEVHKALGPGLLESIYADAMAIELEFKNIRHERQKSVLLTYRERPLRSQRIDLVVEDQVLVELKATERLQPVHHAQVISYLRASGLRVGLLLNFNSHLLRESIRRIVL